MGYDSDAEEKQRHANLLASIRETLLNPAGRAVIQHLFERSQLFVPCADPADYGLRVLFEDFYRDIEEAHPAAALRIFALCRGLPLVNPQQE